MLQFQEKLKRFPYVCSCCNLKSSCHKRKYYYNYKKAQENYEYLLHNFIKVIDMTVDEIDYWNDYLMDKLKNKNQPVLHLYNTIEKDFNEYLAEHPDNNVIEMDTIIVKIEDKRCILTLYFKNSKLLLLLSEKNF